MFDTKLNVNKRQTHISTITNIGKEKKNNHQMTDRRYRVATNQLSTLWGEYRVQGKMIESRANHISCIYKDKFYVHGGKNNQNNSFGDVQCLKLKGNEHELQEWEMIEPVGPRLKRHTSVVREEQWVVYGGLDETDQTNNNIHVFCLDYHEWTILPQKNNIDALDSHSAVITEQNNMLIFGGFIKEKGNYSNSIYEFDFSTSSWNTLFDSSQIDKQSKRPCGRCHSSMCIFNDKVYIFGGMNGNHKLNDFWCFDLKTKKWTQVEASKNTPCERSGHDVIMFKDKMYLFGGIQDLTKEKNDFYYYDFTNQKWVMIFESDQGIDQEDYKQKQVERDASPDQIIEEVQEVVQQKKKKYNPLQETQIKTSNKYLSTSHKKTQEMKQTQMSTMQPMNAIAEQKSKVRSQNKQNLLNQFEIKEEIKEDLRLQTPLTEAMRNSIEVIQHKNVESRTKRKEEGKQAESNNNDFMDIIDFSKEPCPRDGHSLALFKKKVVIFGGDRHKMSFNDVFLIQLDRVQEQLR